MLRKHGLRGTLRLAASKGYVRLFGREALRQYQQQEEAFDQTHRIDTAGRIPLAVLDADSPHARFGNAYQPTSPGLFGEILASLEIAHERFVFVDFGSGKGRVVLLASQVPFRKVVGVEFSSQLHRVAQQNLERFAAEKRRCGSIELLCMDATQYPIPDEDAVLYFYNPFEQQVMDIVLANLQASLARRPRTIYLVLVNVGYPVAPAGFVSVPAHTGYKKVVILKSP